MNKKMTDMERLRLINTHKGSLDYAEFVVDPDNKMSDSSQIGSCVASYFEDLGISDREWRSWLLGKMREARQARVATLENNIRGGSNV